MSQKKKQFTNSTEVRRELASIYHLVKSNKMDNKQADCLKGILNSIQISISGELKEKEIQTQEQLAEELRKVNGNE